MKQTAVDWLVMKWTTQGTLHSSDITQALEMEKEQIKEAYDTGIWDVGCRNSDSKRYYNETYGDE
jgi:hypothetical protein